MATILLVDDSVEVREIIKFGLRRHTVHPARNGAEAVQLAEKYSPDIALVDIGIPIIDGFQVCRYFREDSTLIGLPIICISGKTDVEDKLSAFRAGADDYIIKPFNIDELSARIDALLRRMHRISANETVVQVGGLRLDMMRRQVSLPDGKIADLTLTEVGLLKYLMEHAGMIIPSVKLMQYVLQYPPGVGNTALVRVHIHHLRKKIEANPAQPRWLRSKGQQGYYIST